MPEQTRESQAKALYEHRINNDPKIHTNRFVAWSEMTAEQKEPWLAKIPVSSPLGDQEQKCQDGLLPDGPTCPECGGKRGPSGINGGTWVHASTPTPPAETEARRCNTCNAPRKGALCHKCGGATTVPCIGWIEPELPPVARIRTLARDVGYAIGVHGTQERDLDVIAAPWTEDALPCDGFVAHLAHGLAARVVDSEDKPLGRRAFTLQMDGWYRPIDLTVCPIASHSPREALPEMPADVAHAIREARHPNWRTRLCMDVGVARESVRMLVTAVVYLADLLSHREREITEYKDKLDGANVLLSWKDGEIKNLAADKERLEKLNTEFQNRLCTVRDHLFIGDPDLSANTVEEIDAFLAKLHSSAEGQHG